MRNLSHRSSGHAARRMLTHFADLAPMMQLDIFDHSRDVMLRNDVARALEHHDAAAAQTALAQLAQEFAHDDSLHASRVLVEALDRADATTFDSHEDARRARLRLEQHVAPAALRVLGASAHPWMAHRWKELAQRARALAFDAACPDVHAAALWLQAHDWQAAESAVTAIASWRRIPAPLAWMAEARLHTVGLQATWPLLAELAWLAPARLGDVAQRSPDPQLPRLVGEFERSFEGDGDVRDLAWFPAWALTQKAALREQLASAQACLHTPPEQAMRAMVELLGLEHQGRHHDLVARRKVLRDLHAALYAAYMRTR
jgi:hypothetical protein